MAFHSIKTWQHSHDFSVDHRHAEKRTKIVMVLTAAMMVVEIAAGTLYGSMALLADGWHMATHVAAFGVAVFAYQYAHKHANNPAYTFGTGKVNVLGGFASAIGLAVVAIMMAFESLLRVFQPHAISFNEAIAVAGLGLVVNLASGWLLKEHHHDHDHDHDRHHGDRHLDHHDHNLRAAYLHVVADALTSVFAIVALLAGKYFGWRWMDPLMGVVGAIVIARWSFGLMRDTGSILLDGGVESATTLAIKAAIEAEPDNQVSDLHVWKVGSNHLAAIVSVVTHTPKPPEYYKALLIGIPKLSHVAVEVNACNAPACGTGRS